MFNLQGGQSPHLHKLALSLEPWEIRPRASFLAQKLLSQQELAVFSFFSHFLLPSASFHLSDTLSCSFPLSLFSYQESIHRLGHENEDESRVDFLEDRVTTNTR